MYTLVCHKGYIFLSESGLYYLQARYYNPEIGRFINADAYVSTGQGLLGTNMFSYCGNNPVVCYDPDGRLTRGQIHDLVLDHLVNNLNNCGRRNLSWKETCIYYNKKNASGGWGFCDLYDSKTGEVWELKRSTCNLVKAATQLDGYISGALKSNLKLPLIVGGRLLAEGQKVYFTHTDTSGTYNIWYWDNGNGILCYDYTYQKSNFQKVTDGLQIGALTLGAILLGVSTVLTAGATAPETVIVVIVLFDTASKTA